MMGRTGIAVLFLLALLEACATPRYLHPAKVEKSGKDGLTIECPQANGATGFKVWLTNDGPMCEMIYE